MQPSHKLAHYEILEPIGKGAMGEVYRARDSKLGRDVAIKVLPDDLAQNEERLARFKREAKVLASLNHPNIAAIYGLEQSESTHCLVLELVEGETLAARISRGPIPVEEAIEIANKIAEALEEAHEQRIVHRDLKPANIMLTPDGKVKVLDFGLAKAFVEEISEVESSMSPTISRDATRVGVILGTAAYMSPEQAKAKRVDKRTDIFAFGAVLYEMLTGSKAFPGDEVAETLASVINREPDWSLLPSSLPASARTVLKRCVEKDPRRRLRDVGDARLELEALEATSYSAEKAGVGGFRLRTLVATSVTASLITASVFVGLRVFSRAEQNAVVRSQISLPSGAVLDQWGGGALSPDGTKLVYVVRQDGVKRLFVRSLSEFDAVPIADTEGAHTPFFSPDGNWLGFFANGKLYKHRLSGGAPVVICSAPSANFSRGATWGTDDVIVFAAGPGSPLYRVDANGGAPTEATSLRKGELDHSSPHTLPTGGDVIFTSNELTGPRLWLLTLETGERRELEGIGRGGETQNTSPRATWGS